MHYTRNPGQRQETEKRAQKTFANLELRDNFKTSSESAKKELRFCKTTSKVKKVYKSTKI